MRSVGPRIWIVWIALLGLVPVPAARADSLFHWVDDKGVHHFTNIRPPDGVDNLGHIEEIPYNADADEERRERDSAYQVQRELEAVQERLEDAERQAEEASRRAEEAERKADQLADEVRRKEQVTETRYTVAYPYWWVRPHRERFPWKLHSKDRPRRPPKGDKAEHADKPRPHSERRE